MGNAHPTKITQMYLNLEELAELAKIVEDKMRNFDRESQKIAEKWQNWAGRKHQSVNHQENS